MRNSCTTQKWHAGLIIHNTKINLDDSQLKDKNEFQNVQCVYRQSNDLQALFRFFLLQPNLIAQHKCMGIKHTHRGEIREQNGHRERPTCYTAIFFFLPLSGSNPGMFQPSKHILPRPFHSPEVASHADDTHIPFGRGESRDGGNYAE